MRESSTGGPENKEAWVRLLVLPLFCLRKTHRKGNASKLRLSPVNQQQIAAFNRGEYTLPVGTKSPFLPPKNDNGKLILENLDEGDMRGAVRLAASDDSSRDPAKKLYKSSSRSTQLAQRSVGLRLPPRSRSCTCLKDKFVLPYSLFLPAALQVPQAGLRPQHLKDAVSSSANEAGNQLLASVTEFCNLFLCGDLPEFIKSVLSSATLTSLAKKCGGIRPIAIGETLRCLTAKCVSRRMLRKFQSFSEPLQIGAGGRNEREATSHAAREYLASACADEAFVKIDFSNAFNSVIRDTMFEIIAEHASTA